MSLRALAPDDRVARLEREVSDLRARVAQLEAQRLSRRDRQLLTRLLPAIVGQHGSDSLLTAEIVQDPRLQILISGWSAARLGWLFRRGCNVPIGRYVVTAAGHEGHARLWQVLEVLRDSSSD